MSAAIVAESRKLGDIAFTEVAQQLNSKFLSSHERKTDAKLKSGDEEGWDSQRQ